MTVQSDLQSRPGISGPSAAPRQSSSVWKLFLASFAALYFELVIIRYLSTEIRVFAYLKNLPLIASFFGIGLGMILGSPRKSLKSWFAPLTLLLFLLIAFAPLFRLTHIPLPFADYYVWAPFQDVSKLVIPLRFLGEILGILALVTLFFVVLGGIVGEYISQFKPLPGYGINLAGSLAGVALFTLLAFLRLPPVAWTLIGVACLIPFFRHSKLAIILLLAAAAVTFPRDRHTFWSPYYRIDLYSYPSPQGWPQAPAYRLEVNHDFHQHILNLSDAFVSRYPNFEPNHSARINYEIPYLVMPHPSSALVVGAGTGNDVAAALRHGVGHIDAVEIDPVIIKLGRVYHPEHPYDSPLVKIYNDDARAFFKKATQQYDLIIFGFLDSHTLLSSFSSLRLDNFVYTRESFQEAGRLLRPNGAIVLSFSSGRSFVNDRMYATLQSAFGIPPQVYDNGYVDGLTFVVQKNAQKDAHKDAQNDLQKDVQKDGPAQAPLLSAHDISAQYAGGKAGDLVATDQWPFLYLASRRIPKSILWVLALFLIAAFFVLRRTVAVPLLSSRESVHLFLLGAGFLLLETKGVTELSLLFGSTWTVNAVVIAAFLCMGLLANVLIMYRPFPQALAYIALFLLLLLSLVLPYSLFSGLSAPLKVLAASIIVGLPVFFSGMIFSRSFRGVSSPAQALGVNLFGAVVGGTLENAVMIGGTMSLGILAIALYALSAIFAGRSTATIG
jgi:spermidine synthase